MNKAYSLLITVFSTFSAQFAMAEDETTTSAGFEYAYQPLSWYTLDELTAAEKEDMPSFCSGKYRPIALVPRTEESIQIEANESSITKKGEALFVGDIEFSQLDRQIFSDQATWTQENRIAEFSGNVTVLSPQMVITADYAKINEGDQVGHFEDSEFVIPTTHMRGTAASIDSTGESLITLQDSTYTFCEPNRNDWDIKASEINLDRENGVGSAWNARLRIKEFPILYLPYYRFPIDGRRMTGFLDPTIVINEKLQAEEISLPFYINLHPQADATITPKELLDHGLLWQAQLRHLTSTFGYGELNYGILRNDRSYLQDETETDPVTGEEVSTNAGKQDRWSINYQQSGNITGNWNHRWEYNRVSDNEYFNDMSPSGSINRETHLPTRGEIYFDQAAWHFDVIGEGYQTIDDTIADASRPYQRIPQVNFTYSPETIIGWGGSMTTQATQFERSSDNLTGINAVNGTRLVFDTSINYTFEWPFAYITPKAEYKVRQYNLTDADQSLLDEDFDENPAYAIPKYSVDAGLFFERPLTLFDGDFIQTLEPRIMHLQVPYVDQSDIPNFDSSETTFNYNQLFRDTRFNGNDRIGDTNQTTLGVTTRFLRDSDGNEQFNASIGQIFYHKDRQVQLVGDTLGEEDLTKSSSTVIESNWSPYEEWRLYSMLEWGQPPALEGEDVKDEVLQQQFSIEYNDRMNHMVNLSLRENVATEIRQLDLGVFWAINDSWALIGNQKIDLWDYEEGDIKPVDSVIASLAGIEYQTCCWSTRFVYQEQTKRVTDVNESADKSYTFLLLFEFKGLGMLGSDSNKIIGESIRGYSTRRYFDFESE
jgi:LPS-assembly protein